MAHKNKTNWSAYRARNPNKKDVSRGHLRSTENYSFSEASDRIYDAFRNHGFGDYPHDKREKLVRFYQLLMNEQEFNNFTRILNIRDVAIKHFIDSLIVANLTKLQYPLLDIGTGPGFPGVPLQINAPQETVFLAEGVQKRVNFLKKVRDELELNKLGIFGRNINPQFLYPVNGVITRAVEDIRNTLGNVLYSLQTGGQVYFMKGPNVGPEIDMAKDMSEFFELEKDIAYELPRSPHKRRLVIYRKIKSPPPLDLEKWLDEEWANDEAEDR